MNGVPMSFQSAMQKFVTLSVMEAKIVAGVMVAQRYVVHVSSVVVASGQRWGL